MKTAITILFFSIYFVCINAQTQVRYTYDSAGNRIKKEKIVMIHSVSEEEESREYYDLISGKNVTIHPNNSEGLLNVGISNWEKTDRCTILLLTGTGRLVVQTQATSASVDIDIHDLKNDIYILNINLNGEVSSWKLKIG